VNKRRKAFAMSRRRRSGMIGLCLLVVLALVALDHAVIKHKVRPLLLGANAANSDYGSYDAKSFLVIRAVDGDTLDIDAPDNGQEYTRVRLLGIDTPETKGVAEPAYFGPEAAAFTSKLVEDEEVTLYLPGDRTRGYYGRLLAYVKLPDGHLLNEVLLAEGYAYADTRFPHDFYNKYQQLESMARAQHKGLWSQVRPDQMPEWLQK
jgi:micrococcal nuclease